MQQTARAAAGSLIVVEPAQDEKPNPDEIGVPVRTRNAALRVTVGALAQVVAGQDPGGGSGFRLRRTRLFLDGQLERTLHLEVHFELEVSPASELVKAPLAEAWLGFDAVSRALLDAGRLRVGQLRVPFGGELQTPADELVFVERAYGSRCLGPGAQDFGTPQTPQLGEATGRDLGMRYDVGIPAGGVQVGVAGGLFAGRGPNVVEPVAPMYAARVDVARGAWLERARVSVDIGASYAWSGEALLRQHCTFPSPATDLLDVNGLHRFGADARLRWRRLTATAEAIAVKDFGTGGVTAWSAAGAFAVDVLPEFLELAFRVEDYDHSSVERFVAVTGGVALRYYGDRFRLQYNYVRRIFQSGGPDDSGHLVAFVMAL